MGTKNNPAPFDCYANAEPDEPMFILLARDESAPGAIKSWCYERVLRGANQPGDPQIMEALECAVAMEAWREANRG